jgi:replication factor C large subunit
LWVEKYRPKRIASMVGNEEARLKLLNWLGEWKAGSKAAFLVGPPGTGKTTLVHLLAEEERVNLVELNASDARSRDKLSHRIGEVVSSTSLYGDRSLIFLDEVDGIAGRKDYGAVEFIRETIKTSKNPIVLAANDPEADEVRRLSDASLIIRMKAPPPREVELYLRSVMNREGIVPSEERLQGIVRRANGDLRYAINSLQSGVSASKDRELTVVQALNSFFEAKDSEVALRLLRDYPRQPRDKLRDLYTSVAKAKIPPQMKAEALGVLSRADILMGRIMTGKDWRLLRYLDNMLAHELKGVLEGEAVQYSQDSVTWNLQLRLWNDSRKVREITRFFSSRLHIGQRSAAVQDIPYIFSMCSNRKFRSELIKSLNLDEMFEKFLLKEAARTMTIE